MTRAEIRIEAAKRRAKTAEAALSSVNEAAPRQDTGIRPTMRFSSGACSRFGPRFRVHAGSANQNALRMAALGTSARHANAARASAGGEKEDGMTDAPKTIDLVHPGFGGWRLWTADDADDPTVVAAPYILAAEHERLMAERDAEIARLWEALLDATAYLVGAASSYRTYARRGGDIRPRAEVDAFFTTRVGDYDRAAERARAALGDDNG
jgi:hypothetical protein